ncbi:MAG: hypothetical protein AAFW84_09140 [Cyanobacteria bacterium J06635_15]
MKSEEMELQAIKEKLQRVRQEPLSSEAATLPWVPPSRAVSPNAGSGATSIRPSVHQYAAAVETLKQRSSQHLQTFRSDGQSQTYAGASEITSAEFGPPSRQPTTPQPWEMEVHLQALAKQAAHINQLSEHQEAAMLAMKAIADQISFEGYDMAAWNDQNVLSGEMAAALCEFQSAVVPMVQQTRRGTYVLDYREVDLYRDHRQAQEVAGDLRDRRQEHIGFDLANRLADLGWGGLWTESLAVLSRGGHWVTHLLNKGLKRVGPSPKPHSKYAPQQRKRPVQSRSRLTPLDGLIWFSGAAIVRICLDFVVAKNPVLFPYIAISMLGIGLFVLYRSTLAPRPNYTLGFRLLIVIAGLVVGGRF